MIRVPLQYDFTSSALKPLSAGRFVSVWTQKHASCGRQILFTKNPHIDPKISLIMANFERLSGPHLFLLPLSRPVRASAALFRSQPMPISVQPHSALPISDYYVGTEAEV